MILKKCRLYNVFGSGTNHGLYMQFMAQSALVNQGCKVGLMRGASTHMALWFYAMMQALRLRQLLTATIHQQTFVDLTLKDSTKAAVCEIKDNKFWKCIYILLHAVFLALRLLPYCNKNEPAMDKIFFLPHRTTVAIDMSVEFLNDKTLFGAHIVLGGAGDADNDSNDDNVIFNDAPHHTSETQFLPIVNFSIIVRYLITFQ
jgi:hypothetical protein